MSDDLRTRFARLKEKLDDPKFQQGQGVSNEVGYYIFDYDPKDELELRKLIDKLADSSLASRVNLKIFDMFDVLIKLLKQQGEIIGEDPIPILESLEADQGIAGLGEQINNILQMTENNNMIVQYVKESMPDKCIIFLTGLGKVYPLIRAHKILNTMHQVLDGNPVVMFYPGDYDEISLRAFGEVKDQNYYRAFKIE